MRKTINNALVQTIRCFLYSICKKWFSTEHRFCQNLHSVNFVPFIRFVKVFERRQNATKKSNTTRTQRENRKRIWGRGGRLSCGRGHARSEPLNGKRHCGVLHQRGQDPGKTTRRLKQRARGRRDERLPRGNHKRKQFTHTCSDKQWTEESATTKNLRSMTAPWQWHQTGCFSEWNLQGPSLRTGTDLVWWTSEWITLPGFWTMP